LPAGTVLLSSRAPIGYIAIANMPVAVNQGFIALVCSKNLSNHYVVQWLKENMDVIESRANGTTFLEISKTNFRPIPVVVPSQSVIERFEVITSKLYSRLVSNVRQTQHLSGLRDTLLPRLLSGELRVGQAEKMVEGA
jgi:type I restriction enzyme, S subunit